MMACRLASGVDVHQARAGVSALRCSSPSWPVALASGRTRILLARPAQAIRLQGGESVGKGGERALCRLRLGANISG